MKRRRKAVSYHVYRLVEVKADFDVTERGVGAEKLILIDVLASAVVDRQSYEAKGFMAAWKS